MVTCLNFYDTFIFLFYIYTIYYLYLGIHIRYFFNLRRLLNRLSSADKNFWKFDGTYKICGTHTKFYETHIKRNITILNYTAYSLDTYYILHITGCHWLNKLVLMKDQKYSHSKHIPHFRMRTLLLAFKFKTFRSPYSLSPAGIN